MQLFEIFLEYAKVQRIIMWGYEIWNLSREHVLSLYQTFTIVHAETNEIKHRLSWPWI